MLELVTSPLTASATVASPTTVVAACPPAPACVTVCVTVVVRAQLKPLGGDPNSPEGPALPPNHGLPPSQPPHPVTVTTPPPPVLVPVPVAPGQDTVYTPVLPAEEHEDHCEQSEAVAELKSDAAVGVARHEALRHVAAALLSVPPLLQKASWAM